MELFAYLDAVDCARCLRYVCMYVCICTGKRCSSIYDDDDDDDGPLSFSHGILFLSLCLASLQNMSGLEWQGR